MLGLGRDGGGQRTPVRWAERDSVGGMAQASRARKEEKQVASKELKVVLCGRAEPAQVRRGTGRRRKLPPGEQCLSKVLESMLRSLVSELANT